MRIPAARVRLIFGPGLGACGVIASSIKGRRGSRNSKKIHTRHEPAKKTRCLRRAGNAFGII
jgi:hypothetical protein